MDKENNKFNKKMLNSKKQSSNPKNKNAKSGKKDKPFWQNTKKSYNEKNKKDPNDIDFKENIINLNSNLSANNFVSKKNILIITIFIFLIMFALIIRLFYLQFIQSDFLQKQAYNQQTVNQIISPNRGNIYDSTGKALAISAPVDTITINPSKFIVKDSEKDTILLQETIAIGLSEIFALDYNEVLTKVQSTATVETIIKKVEQDKVDALVTWMDEYDIKVGINIDEDIKRYYPYDNVLSSVIGFCGTDNTGLAGLEYTWNNVLTGTPGKIVSSQGNDQREIPNSEETYIAAENGSDIELTVDLNIQTIAEKYLEQAIDTYDCEEGGNVIAMDPKTGDILAMASFPDYNLNTPYVATSDLAQQYADESIYKMWSNKSVADTYEPGSTFKIITSAIALEENITTPDVYNDFYCNGFEEFPDINNTTLKIKCWRAEPHREQSLRDALLNSCNPSFMQLGERITTPTLYKYYNAFGLFNSTNSSLYGEQSSIFLPEQNVGPVDLATISFGQGLNVTPLQLITSLSALANDGILMQPRIVKSITNADTNVTTEIQPVTVRQVVSEETSDQILSMMEDVVTIGTGINATVEGYTIGGKTGTSEDLIGNDDEYIASFVATAPAEDPEIVLLLTLYNPTNEKYGFQGGQLAAPTVSQMLSEILPYMGVTADTEIDSNNENLITVPEIRNKTITEANKILSDLGFKTEIFSTSDYNTTLVTEQNPKPGSQLPKDSIIILYGEGENVSTSVAVPDLAGMTANQAESALNKLNLNIAIEGTGIVTNQDYFKDDQVPLGTIVKVTLKPALTGGAQ